MVVVGSVVAFVVVLTVVVFFVVGSVVAFVVFLTVVVIIKEINLNVVLGLELVLSAVVILDVDEILVNFFEVEAVVVIRELDSNVEVDRVLVNGTEVVVNDELTESKMKLSEVLILDLISLILIFKITPLFAMYKRVLATMMLPLDRLSTKIELGGLSFRAKFILFTIKKLLFYQF